jgi:hypothetical protein
MSKSFLFNVPSSNPVPVFAVENRRYEGEYFALLSPFQ